nr:sugar phosphate nucleotidyltransferase [Candidatus Sigynarchaeum springense]
MTKKMKIICPIAGVGKRLQPFTFTKPKAFLKVAGKTILDHAMNMLKETFPEHTEILFVTGYKKEMIIKHVMDLYSDYFQLRFVEQEQRGIVDDVPIFPGLGHAIYLARKSGFLPKGNTEHGMFVFLSDRLPIDGYHGIVEKFENSDLDGFISVSIVKHPEHYGVVVPDKDGVITKMVEKPKEYIANTAISGAYVFNAKAANEILDYLESSVMKPLRENQEHQFTPALQNLVEKKFRIGAFVMHHEVIDIGQPEAFITGNKYFLETMKCPSDFHQVEDSHIVLPSFIGKGVSIKNSIVGPNVSIGDNVSITSSIIQNSLVGDGSSLTRVITTDSIIGDGCHLEDIIKSQITVGDRSVISSTKRNNGY